MSNDYRAVEDVPIDVLARRLETLSGSIVRRETHELTLRVPAELDRDADIVLSEVALRIHDLRAAFGVLRGMVGENDNDLDDVDSDTVKAFIRSAEKLFDGQPQ